VLLRGRERRHGWRTGRGALRRHGACGRIGSARRGWDQRKHVLNSDRAFALDARACNSNWIKVKPRAIRARAAEDPTPPIPDNAAIYMAGQGRW